MYKAVVVVGLCCVLGALAEYAMPNNMEMGNNMEMRNNMEMGNNMPGNMDLDAVMKHFDPKLVVVKGMDGEAMSPGVHAALVKSLISDFHSADVPVIYAEKRDVPNIQ